MGFLTLDPRYSNILDWPIMEDLAKGLVKIHVIGIHCPELINPLGHFLIRISQYLNWYT